MDRKRAAEAYIKPDPDLKRVKKEEDDDHCDLSSIPRAHHTFAASSAPTFVKAESSDGRKPLEQRFHRAARRPRPYYIKNKPFPGQSLLVRRGWNWVHAHLNKRDMMIELNIYYYRDIPWDLEGVETEIFQRLHRAYMFVEPVEEPGFLIEYVTNIKKMLGQLWYSPSLGKPDSGPVNLALDGKEVSFSIYQDKSKDLFCSFAVRPLEENVEHVVKFEDNRESSQPRTLDHRGIKIEEESD